MTGFTYSFQLSDIPRFETNNKISFTLFGYEKNGLFPIHITGKRYDKHINLLLIPQRLRSHYFCVKDFCCLFNSQSKHTNRRYVCNYYLHCFIRVSLLDENIPYCQLHGPQKTEIPKEEDKWLYYKEVGKQHKVTYVGYAYCKFCNIVTSVNTSSFFLKLRFRVRLLSLYTLSLILI